MSIRRRPKYGGIVVAPGDHLLLVDDKLNLRAAPLGGDALDARARELYAANPGASIVHVMVVATYTAPDDPLVETYAERRME